MKHTMTKRESREARAGWLFISPWLIGFLCLTGGPLLFSLYASFTNYNMTSRMDFIGLSNYIRMFTKDPVFWKSLGNTLYYVALAVPSSCICAIFLATLLNQKVKGTPLFRMLFYLPTVLSGVAVYQLWMQLLAPQSGLINSVLRLVGIEGPSWLSDPAWTKPSLVMMRVWALGTSMLLYLSSMNSVSKDLYEAADIDGASFLQKFRKITLPQISPIIFFDIITNMTGAFQVFQEALVMSKNGKGDPAGSLLFYNLHIYQEAFTHYDMGYASAMAWFLLLIVMTITVINLVASKYWVHTEEGET
ncbi:ABC transporter permease subunit [Hungatella hathewayi]|nr:sugar ABC transporter permease [Hungatella hathewayi]MBT9798325.1 ABC transporter permease subunit [Hungatella hathewayi]MUB66214.1 ABC transporter permease subunit [Hungatella hathewayi]RHB69706.1 sugar ABC transporter permease [Hungatella hathewayi]